MGIDEISMRKGQGNYCAVLVDLDQLLALVPARTQEAIEKVLLDWGIDVLSSWTKLIAQSLQNLLY